MATTKIFPVGDLSNTLEYITNPKKTDGKKLISAINCFPNTALEEMNFTKNIFNKNDLGIEGYHIIQSFVPGETTADEAHRIGCELTEKLYGDYQCVISTHIDHEHIHNHIVFNSVNPSNGKKFHENFSYASLRKSSDEICKDNGLSLIRPKNKGKKYKEWSDNKMGRSTLRECLRKDIDYAIDNSLSYNDFCKTMTDNGYKMKQDKYLAFRNTADGNNFIRTTSIGDNYSQKRIRERIFEKRISTESKNILQDYINFEINDIEFENPLNEYLPDEINSAYQIYKLGKIYLNGDDGCEKNPTKAIELFEIASDNGFASAAYALGNIYKYGQVTNADFDKAFQYYLIASNGSYPSCYAQYELAKLYERGIGCEKDEAMTNKYYKMAYEGFSKAVSKKAFDKSIYRLGYMTLKGLGCEKDIMRAIELFKRSAQMNNADAFFALGNIAKNEELCRKYHIEYNPKLAIAYFQQSIELGNKFADVQIERIMKNINNVRMMRLPKKLKVKGNINHCRNRTNGIIAKYYKWCKLLGVNENRRFLPVFIQRECAMLEHYTEQYYYLKHNNINTLEILRNKQSELSDKLNNLFSERLKLYKQLRSSEVNSKYEIKNSILQITNNIKDIRGELAVVNNICNKQLDNIDIQYRKIVKLTKEREEMKNGRNGRSSGINSITNDEFIGKRN